MGGAGSSVWRFVVGVDRDHVGDDRWSLLESPFMNMSEESWFGSGFKFHVPLRRHCGTRDWIAHIAVLPRASWAWSSAFW